MNQINLPRSFLKFLGSGLFLLPFLIPISLKAQINSNQNIDLNSPDFFDNWMKDYLPNEEETSNTIVLSDSTSWSWESALEYGLNNNLSIRKKDLEIENQKISVTQSKYNHLPNLNLGATQQIGDNFLSNSNPSWSRGTSISLNSNLPIYAGGRLLKATEINQTQLKLKQKERQTSEQNFATQLAETYSNLVIYQELYVLQLDLKELARQLLNKGSIQFQQGNLTRQEWLDLASNFSTEIADLEVTGQNLIQYQINFASLLNNSINQNLSLKIADAQFKELLKESESFDTNEFLSNNHEIQTQELNLNVARQQVEYVRSSYWPELNLNASIGTGFSDPVESSWQNQSRDRANYNLSLNLQIPIFDRGATSSEVSQAQLQVRQEELNLEQLKKDLLLEATQLLGEIKSLKKQHKAAELAFRSAEESFKYAQLNYDQGQMDFYEFQQSRSTYKQASQNLSQRKWSLWALCTHWKIVTEPNFQNREAKQ